MADIVSPEVRSRMMSGIRGKDTKPELTIRTGLHRLGFRYKLHDRRLPGKPDIVFPKYHAVILVNGCFWHSHDCHLFRLPETRKAFWKKKFATNRANDIKARKALLKRGWRVLTIWECALKGKTRQPRDEVVKRAASWLRSDVGDSDIRGASENVGGRSS